MPACSFYLFKSIPLLLVVVVAVGSNRPCSKVGSEARYVLKNPDRFGLKINTLSSGSQLHLERLDFSLFAEPVRFIKFEWIPSKPGIVEME